MKAPKNQVDPSADTEISLGRRLRVNHHPPKNQVDPSADTEILGASTTVAERHIPKNQVDPSADTEICLGQQPARQVVFPQKPSRSISGY